MLVNGQIQILVGSCPRTLSPPPQAGSFQRLGGSAFLCGAEETLGEAKGAAVMAEMALALWTRSEPIGDNYVFFCKSGTPKYV